MKKYNELLEEFYEIVFDEILDGYMHDLTATFELSEGVGSKLSNTVRLIRRHRHIIKWTPVYSPAGEFRNLEGAVVHVKTDKNFKAHTADGRSILVMFTTEYGLPEHGSSNGIAVKVPNIYLEDTLEPLPRNKEIVLGNA